MRGLNIEPNHLHINSIRSLVCDECWAGPFAFESFRRLTGGEDIPYTTTWTRVKESAAGGCGFCGLLVTDMPEDLELDESHVSLAVTFTVKFGFARNPTSTFDLASTRIQFLDYEFAGPEGEPEVLDNGMWLRASPGTSVIRMAQCHLHAATQGN